MATVNQGQKKILTLATLEQAGISLNYVVLTKDPGIFESAKKLQSLLIDHWLKLKMACQQTSFCLC